MPARILIAEDNRPSLELFEYLLQARGYATTSASDGGKALRLARQMHPDLIVCDLQMPVLNGYEILAALRQDPVFAAIPIIAVTAFSMLGDREKALSAGFTSHISKPIDPETFVGQIESFLSPELRNRMASQHGQDTGR